MSERAIDAEPFDFEGDYGAGYEALARTVIPGYESTFRMATALLEGVLGGRARILVVGAGTGIEIVTLRRARPDWSCTGVDPSRQMIDIARRRVDEAGVADGVELRHGHVADLPAAPAYGAATCFNVLHFLPDDGAKAALLGEVARRLAPGAPFVLLDLHGDPASPRFAEMFAAWRAYWRIQGMGTEERAAFEAKLEAGIHWSPESRVLELLAGAGFEDVRPFFRGLLYRGWIATRRA